jgi:hypothetical protein
MAPQKKLFSKSFDLENMTVTISTAKRAETFPIEGMPRTIVDSLILHGLTQKLADKCASSAGSLSEDEKWEAMLTVHASLRAGQWSLKGESAGSMLFRALVELAGPTADKDAIRAKLDAWTPAEKRAVAASGRVAPIIRRLEAERVTEVDSDSLLDDLLG